LIVLSRVARGGIAVIAFFFLLAAPAGSATPEELPPAAMFWAQSPHGAEKEAGTIGRAELSGAGAQESLVAGASAPAGVAVDDHHIYWANYGSGTIGRANLDGSEANEQFISGAESPIGVAVEGGHIYWTNQLIFASEGGAIGRANLDGSDVHQRFIRTRGRPAALAVDSEHVYWTNEYSNRYTAKGYAIGRASLSGAGVEERFIPVSNSTDGVAVNGSFVFWTNVGEHALGRANLNGTGVVPRCITLRTPPLENVPEGVALNGQHVYWTNYPADTIARANLDGSEAVERFLPISGVPAGIAVGDEGGPPSSAGPCPTSKLPLLFGPINPPFAGPYTKGWGEVAPAVISNGGLSASGTISQIHWTSWGAQVAVGQGLHPTFRPQGGYYSKPVVIQLHASRIRRCKPRGRLVYTRFTVRQQVRPGGPMGRWSAWASNMCSDY
jgi:hypothetical protein